MKTAKTAEINYGEIKATWNVEDNSIKAASFPLATIYDDSKVQLTANEFAALTGTPTQTEAEGDKAWFDVAPNTNVLTATVKAKTSEGKYPIEVVFTSTDKARVITVKATIVVENPKFTALKVNDLFWEGTSVDGKVGITPTLDSDTKPTKITAEFTLSNLFSNYSAIKEEVKKVEGASLTITVPGVADIVGVAYVEETTMLTFTPAEYTGLTKEGKPATVRVVAQITLQDGEAPLQEYSAVVSIKNLSGSWKAGSLTANLDDKSKTYELAKGFAWKDSRDAAMWENGAVVSESDKFGEDVTNPLSIYGLTAPTFEFVNAEGETVEDEYLEVDNTGKLKFTDKGKNFNFVKSYTTRVKIVADSQWGDIMGYKNNNIITVTIPTGIK